MAHLNVTDGWYRASGQIQSFRDLQPSCWFDYSDQSTVTIGASGIERIYDKVGGVVYAEQLTAADQPTHVPWRNGKYAAYSAPGSNCRLEITTPIYVRSVAIVLESAEASVGEHQEGIFSRYPTGGGGMFLDGTTQQWTGATAWSSSTEADEVNNVRTSQPVWLTPHSLVFTRTTTSYEQNFAMLRNAVQRSFPGYYGQFLFFDRVLSPKDRNLFHYLARKEYDF